MTSEREQYCPQCGDTFLAKSARQKYCTTQCRYDASNHRLPAQTLARRDAGFAVAAPEYEKVDHIMIPDTQHSPGRLHNHLAWAAQYISDRWRDSERTLRVVMIGDHHDMPSLSKHASKLEQEGRRYADDIEYGNDGIAILTGHNLFADLHVTLGNHEDRITRAFNENPQANYSLDHLAWKERGWTVHDFLQRVELDGVVYSHYFYQPMSGRPYGGENLQTRLKSIGHSFSMGHQQTYLTAERYVGNRRIRGLVAGSYYLHDEDYKGPQGNDHWRGLVVCHDVHGGDYDLMEVSMDYLCQRYEGMTLAAFRERFVK